MGIENMRRWPVYIVLAICLLLSLSLFNSWNLETELRKQITDISRQLHECSKQQKSCMEDSLTLLEQKEGYLSKYNAVDKQKLQLDGELNQYKTKLLKAETQANRTQVDVEICRTELQSLKNLQLTKSAMLETLRLKKDTLTDELEKSKGKIEELEKEIEKLKNVKPVDNSVKLDNIVGNGPSLKSSSKMTPVPPALKSPQVLNNPLEPELEDNAKEELEDTNAINDGNNPDINAVNDGNNPDVNDPNDADFDQQIK